MKVYTHFFTISCHGTGLSKPLLDRYSNFRYFQKKWPYLPLPGEYCPVQSAKQKKTFAGMINIHNISEVRHDKYCMCQCWHISKWNPIFKMLNLKKKEFLWQKFRGNVLPVGVGVCMQEFKRKQNCWKQFFCLFFFFEHHIFCNYIHSISDFCLLFFNIF